MGVVGIVNAAGSKLRDMDTQLVAAVNDVEDAKNVGPRNFDLVILAPVGVGRSSEPGAVEDVGRAVRTKLAGDAGQMRRCEGIRRVYFRTCSRDSVRTRDVTGLWPIDSRIPLIWLAIHP